MGRETKLFKTKKRFKTFSLQKKPGKIQVSPTRLFTMWFSTWWDSFSDPLVESHPIVSWNYLMLGVAT